MISNQGATEMSVLEMRPKIYGSSQNETICFSFRWSQKQGFKLSYAAFNQIFFWATCTKWKLIKVQIVWGNVLFFFIHGLRKVCELLNFYNHTKIYLKICSFSWFNKSKSWQNFLSGFSFISQIFDSISYFVWTKV